MQFLKDNIGWVIPLSLAIGAAIAWFAAQFWKSKEVAQNAFNAIIDRQRDEIADLKEVNKGLKDDLAKSNEENRNLMERVFKYQDSELEMSRKISKMEREIQELTSQVNILKNMFPEPKK